MFTLKVLHSPLAIAAVLALHLAVAPEATAQTPPSPLNAAGRAGLNQSDVSFMGQAGESGNLEIESSKLALSKTKNPKVKAFAQQMVDDHTKAAAELVKLANSKRESTPKAPSLSQRAKLKTMDAKDGAEFDKAYADASVKAHDDTVELFQWGSTKPEDADIKAYAAKYLPILQHHQAMANDLKKSLDSPGSATPGPGKSK